MPTPTYTGSVAVVAVSSVFVIVGVAASVSYDVALVRVEPERGVVLSIDFVSVSSPTVSGNNKHYRIRSVDNNPEWLPL